MSRLPTLGRQPTGSPPSADIGATGAGAINRRALLAGMAGAAALTLATRPARATEIAPFQASQHPLRVGERTTRMLAVRPTRRPRAVALFSADSGTVPASYEAVMRLLALDDFEVLAPVHIDSLGYPSRVPVTLDAAFRERIADLHAAAGVAARAYPGLPLVAIGHGFGSLSALCLGGAMADTGAFREPGVKAVLGYSTPGRLPGLVGPTSYRSLAVPTLIVTGTADTVPGQVATPADHLRPIEGAPPGPRYALVLDGGDHQAILDSHPGFGRSIAIARLFLNRYGLGDAEAARQFGGWRPASGDRWITRA